MRYTLSVSLLALALQGCGGALLNDRLITLEWKGPQEAGTIAISDPKLFRREALINERRDEVAWINKLIEDSPNAEFKPEVLREVEVIRAFSLALGLKFDPASGANFSNQQATSELQQEIAELRLQLQLDQLKRDIELVRAGFAEQTEPVNSNLSALGEGNSLGSLPSGITADEAANKLTDTINNLQSRLDAETRGPLGVDDVTTNPIDLFRDRMAYRNILTNARNAATLDEIHDLGDSALVRLNFQATTIPPSNKRAIPAVIQMQATQGSEASKAKYYLNWLSHLNRQAAKADLKTVRKPGEYYLDTLPFAGLFSTLVYREKGCSTNCKSVKYAVPRIEGLNSFQLPESELAHWLGRNAEEEPRIFEGLITCVTGSVRVDEGCVRQADFDEHEARAEMVRQSEEGKQSERQVQARDTAGDAAQTPSKPAEPAPPPKDDRRSCAVDNSLITNENTCSFDLSITRLARGSINNFVKELSTRAYGPSHNPFVKLDLDQRFFAPAPQANTRVKLFDFVQQQKLIVQVAQVLNGIERINFDNTFEAVCEFDQDQKNLITGNVPAKAKSCADLRVRFATTASRASDFLVSLKHALENDRSSTDGNLIRANVAAIDKQLEQVAIIPPRFDALISRQGSDVQIYEVGPREQVQQVGSNARAASSLGIALAVAASKPSTGLGANANSSFSQQATSKVQARERVPAVTGYSVGSKATFGWVLGPTATIDRKGKLDLAQVLTPYDLTVDLSVPKWWGSVQITALNTWSPSQDDIAQGAIEYRANEAGEKKETQNFSVVIPRSASDMEQLTQRLVQGDLSDATRQFRLAQDQNLKHTVAACRTTVIPVTGDQVWRTNAVLIDGYRIGEENISVIPDMTGVLVTVPALDKKVSATSSGSIKATLLSPYGSNDDPITLLYEGAPFPDGCGTPANPDAIRVTGMAEAKIEIRNGTPTGTGKQTFEVAGANLDDVDTIKVRTQVADDIEAKDDGKALEFTLTWNEIRSLPHGLSEVQFYGKDGEVKAKSPLTIEYLVEGGE